MRDPIPDDALRQVEDVTTGVVPLAAITHRKRLIIKTVEGPDIDTEGPGDEEIFFTTADLARQLRECREALRFGVAENVVGETNGMYGCGCCADEDDYDKFHRMAYACLPEGDDGRPS